MNSLSKYTRTKKRPPLGGDFNREDSFNFAYLRDDQTVDYINRAGHVMFILRGPPSTGKATLSEMLESQYPYAVHCCADKYFKNSFERLERTRENLKKSHDYCERRTEEACNSNKNVIIVQNTHMRKWEMQHYVDLAAAHHYTVIMAITYYVFDVTPENLEANNTDGLSMSYCRNRLRQWQDIPPLLTGWFVSPVDRKILLNFMLQSLTLLLGDGKFCAETDIYNIDDLKSFYKARLVLFCAAGLSSSKNDMLKYYLSDLIQDTYGKCHALTIIGYLVTDSVVQAIVRVDSEMEDLVFTSTSPARLSEAFGNLETGDATSKHEETETLSDASVGAEDSTTVVESEWLDDEAFNVSKVSFIQLAEEVDNEGNGLAKIIAAKSKFIEALKEVSDENGNISNDLFKELEGGIVVGRLPNRTWLIKAPKKLTVMSIFTGMYV